MDRSYWHKQSASGPLFPDLLWSRPENKRTAGKLLIVGGHAQTFAAVAEAYARAQEAGIGGTRVLLPDSLQKTVSKLFPDVEFAPSTPSGSFSRQALAEILTTSQWADGLLLAGDFGRNSETAILLEQLADKYSGQLAITKDAVDYFLKLPAILDRPETLLVCSFAQLQKLAQAARFTTAFTYDMDFLRLVDSLHDFADKHGAHIMVKHLETIFAAVNGQISTTKTSGDKKVWRLDTAARASVWWLQNPTKPFEALTTSLV